uniref:Craniofacial development protein 1 n=1 Tax=Sander lucioperca TaxID=283035 RepID=A0A8C9YRC7_SANLU
MNYSDYDSDGYSSNEDADYVPNDCTKETSHGIQQACSVPFPKFLKTIPRKRKKGVLKVDGEEKDGGGADEAQSAQDEVQPKLPGGRQEDDESQKKKSDDLWASFLSDVGSRPKDPPTCLADDSSVLKVAPLSSETKASEPAKVTITQVFDFAGEEVRVKKVVSADSREAKSYLKSQNTKQEGSGDETEEASSPRQPPPPGPSTKRPAGVSGILGRIGAKKQKMSTLEKSKMDWDAFKSEEGITEELAIHNRGREGYVERKNFLERVDHRQFELEKAVRQSNVKQ